MPKTDRRTFTVDNRTAYLTNDLRAIIARVARRIDHSRPQQYIIGYSTKGHRGSFPASITEIKTNPTIGTYRAKKPNVVARLYLPRKADDVQPVQFAIAIYESIQFGSYRGPSDDIRRRVKLNQEYAWADSLGIRSKPPKAKPTTGERRNERRQHTVKLIAQWEKKAKLAKTKLAKYRSRLRRIDKAAEKAAEK